MYILEKKGRFSLMLFYNKVPHETIVHIGNEKSWIQKDVSLV